MSTGRRRTSCQGKLREFGADRSGKKKAEQVKQIMIKRARGGAEGRNQRPDHSGRKPKPRS